MIIANPIYDVVFKYLLEDIEIAKEFLSTILDVKIVSLTVKPQKTLVKSDSGDIRIFRLDFRAVIQLANGEEKMVLIELQKAKQSYDILRFRKYLGKNYQKEEVRKNKKGQSESYSLEIITIYFLGFELNNVTVPILKVKRNYIDAVTGKELIVDEEFINQLTHESYTIQIPRLKLKQQNALEQVLEVFSQEYVKDDLHRIDFQGEQANPLVKKIVRRLTKAAANEKLSEQMDLEDEVDRIINRALAKKDDAYAEKIKEKDAIIEQKDSLIEQKDSLIEKERQEKEQLLAELAQLRGLLKKQNE